MNLKRQTKAADLLDRLNRLVNSDSINQLTLQRIEREAVQLQKTDAAGAYMAQGIVHGMRNDADQSSSFHEKGLRLLDNDLARVNYARSLAYLQLWGRALEQYDRSLNLVQDTTLLEDVVSVAIQSGYPDKAIHYCQQLVKLKPEVSSNGVIKNLMNKVEILKMAEISDEEMAEANELAFSVLRDFGAKMVSSRAWIDKWSDYAPAVVNEFHIKKPDGISMLDMTLALCDRKAEADLPVFRGGKYSVHFYSE